MKKIFTISLVLLMGCKSLINKLAFYPDTTDLPSTLPPGIEEIFIKTEDSIKIQTYLLRNSSDKILIYFHGNAGNISHRISTLQQLYKYGLNILGVSYHGYGKSEGKPSEAGMYLDASAAYNYVISKLNFKPENIIILGRSIGSAAAVHISQNKNLKGLILITPFTDGYDHAKAHGLGLIAFLGKGVFDNKNKINNVKCPVLIIHGTNDEVVPYKFGRHLYELVKSDKKFVKIQNGYHNDLEYVNPKVFWEAIEKFIKTN